MKEYLGTMEEKPEIGKEAIIERLNNGKTEIVMTTKITAIAWIGETIAIMKTGNSIYAVKVTG